MPVGVCTARKGEKAQGTSWEDETGKLSLPGWHGGEAERALVLRGDCHIVMYRVVARMCKVIEYYLVCIQNRNIWSLAYCVYSYKPRLTCVSQLKISEKSVSNQRRE